MAIKGNSGIRKLAERIVKELGTPSHWQAKTIATVESAIDSALDDPEVRRWIKDMGVYLSKKR